MSLLEHQSFSRRYQTEAYEHEQTKPDDHSEGPFSKVRLMKLLLLDTSPQLTQIRC